MPVLSELIAEVDPSVSTEARSLTTALRLASAVAPDDRMIWRTVGIASGIAAIASATAVVKRTVADSPRWCPRANIRIIVTPAAPAIHSVSTSSWRISGVFSLTVVASIPAIFPTSVPLPVPVTIISPLPCVTGVFMNAMFAWSPAPSSPESSVVASLAAGTLSPVSADSSIWSELAATIRPSAGTSSPAASRITSPTTTWSAGVAASAPSRRTRAVAFVIDLSAFIALSALPSWRIPARAFTIVIRKTIAAVLHCLITRDAITAPIRISCM